MRDLEEKKQGNEKRAKLKKATLESMKRPPNLEELLESGLPVYVRNNSKPMGAIHISFISKHGKNEPVIIPRTLLPINISEKVTPEMIQSASSLRRHIASKMVLLVWPADAKADLSTEDAIDELNEIRSSRFSAGSVSKYSASAGEAEKKKALEKLSIVDDDAADVVIDARVQSIVASATSTENPWTPKKAVREIKMIEESLTDDDFHYVIQLAGKVTDLKKYCVEVLEKRENTVGDTGHPAKKAKKDKLVVSS